MVLFCTLCRHPNSFYYLVEPIVNSSTSTTCGCTVRKVSNCDIFLTTFCVNFASMNLYFRSCLQEETKVGAGKSRVLLPCNDNALTNTVYVNAMQHVMASRWSALGMSRPRAVAKPCALTTTACFYLVEWTQKMMLFTTICILSTQVLICTLKYVT